MSRMKLCLSLLLAGIASLQCAEAAQAQIAASAKFGNAVTAKLAQGGKANVVVALKPTARSPGETGPQRAARVSGDTDAVLSSLPAGSYAVRHRFNSVDAIAMDISAAAVPALDSNPAVQRVDLDVGGGANMLEASVVSGVSDVRTAGYTGKGIKVAIIDSGVQVDHPDLADSISDEYCYCSNGTPGVGCCPDGTDVEGGPGSALDANGHGTNVTGIVTGNGKYAPQGGAPDAGVVVVRVLDAQGRFSSTSDIVAALDWVAANHTDIKVVNLSLGTDQLFSSACDNSTAWTMALKQAVDAVVANGALVTASSGNAGSNTSISAPACISGVIAVGAVWDSALQDQTFLGCTDTQIVANKPTCFTNSNALVSIYAPGGYTTATGSNVDPYTSGYAVSYGGTSQAAPLVAACIADLYQMEPRLSPAQITNTLLATGKQVTDPKSGLSFPLLDCKQSMALVDQLFDASFEAAR